MAKELPKKAAPLNQGGINKLVDRARSDPELAQTAADRLDQDPKGAILELFDLNERQRQAIQNTSDEYLRSRTSQIVEALRDPAKAQKLKIHFHPEGADGVVDE